MEFSRHRLVIFFHNDLTSQSINVDAPLAKNVNPMMPVEYSSIRPGFQRVFLARQKRSL
jgi:hypothetical protein